MDINGISSTYASSITDAAASKSASGITSLENQDLTNASDDELMEVCKNFESYFLEQVMKEMTKTIPTTEETDSSNTTLVDYFKDNTITELASNSTEQNSLGLAQMLYEQMKRNYSV